MNKYLNFIKNLFDAPMNMYQFCIKYHLLNNEKDLNSLNKEKAKKLFSSQLGKLWESPDKLPESTKALFAIFAAYGCGDKENTLEIIRKIKLATKNGREPDFSITDKIFEQFKDDHRVKEVYSKHAYVNTVMVAMMEFARASGICTSSCFLWVKSKNRLLFYILYGVGRSIVSVEVAGVFSHWRAEKDLQLSIKDPVVEVAVEMLERTLI